MKRPKREDHIDRGLGIVKPASYIPALENYCDHLEHATEEKEKLIERFSKSLEGRDKKIIEKRRIIKSQSQLLKECEEALENYIKMPSSITEKQAKQFLSKLKKQ